ncbi:MAG: methyltransferase domain-containing protein [Myxococcales bacterium]|nr:methyltransferase domain-containing protein [Myxococcales bacterium]
MRDEPPRGDDHWPRHARQWAQVGAPLRPGPDDVALVEREVAAWRGATARAPRALVLGVTPELVTAAWPAGTTLVALERSASVIGSIYPAATAPAGAAAAQADWRALPVGGGAIDLVVGDGALSTLAFPADYRVLVAEVARALAPGGRLVVRLFTAPEPCERLAEVAAALAGGAIGSFHALKWRVAMAIQPAHRNVAVAEIGRAVEALVPDRAALAARTGWPRAVIDGIDAYRGSTLTYSFPTLAEVRAVVGERLELLGAHAPGYELGDRCPTVAWGAR